MRISKVILAIVIALVFFGACNAALTFVLEPYGSRSQLAWSDYAKQEELDTILVGTSYVEYNIDPAVLNEDCGYASYNLGSPSQTIEESFVGIRTAYEDHHIKRAILGISASSLTSSSPPNPGSAYMHNRSLYVSPIDTFMVTNEFLWHYDAASTAYSLNMLCPWASNPIRSLKPDDLLSNVKAKLFGADVAEMAEKLEAEWHYVGLGHGGRVDSTNLNGAHVRNINEGVDEDAEAGAAPVENTTSVDPGRARTLHEICAYCRDHDIELIVIVPPLPVHNIFDEKSTHFETMDNIRAALAEDGVEMYDFNLAKPELFKSQISDFSDIHHLNLAGAQKFSHSLASFLNSLEAGENVNGMFNTPEEQFLTIDYLSALLATSEAQADGIHLDWRIVTSPESNVEFRVLVKESGEQEYRPASDWMQDTTFTYLPEKHGEVMFHICARMVGSDADYERYRPIQQLW